MKKFILLFVLLFIISNSYADNVYGARPLGIGGAYTGIADDYLAGYWNPAGIYKRKGFDLQLLSLGAGVNFTGNILENANNIGRLADKFIKIKDAQKEGKPIDITQIGALTVAMKNLKEIGEPGSGLLMDVSGGLGVRIGKYIFSASNYTDVGLKPYIDLNFWLGASSPSGVSFENINLSTYTPTNVSIETRDSLVRILNWLRPKLAEAGVEIPTEITIEQLANALINLAGAHVSESEIQDAIKIVNENKPLIESLLKGGTPFKDNQSNLTFKGLNITEICLGRAWRFFLPDLYIGANLKLLIGHSRIL